VLQWIESTPNSSAFIVSEPPPPPNRRTLSTSIGLTACPLSFLSRLRVLYLCWAVFTPLPSCVGCVSTASPPADYTTTTPGSLEHLRSLEQRAATLEQRIYRPSFRIDYSTFYHLCVDYSFVSTTSPRVDYFLTSATPYINIIWKYSVMFKISSSSGLWTADTWAMSADAQLCDSGQWTPRDRRWQFWPCIPEVWTPHGEDRKLYCEPYIAYLRPCNLDDDSDL